MKKFAIFQIAWMPFGMALSAMFGAQCAKHGVPAYAFIPSMLVFALAVALFPWGVRYAIQRALAGE